MKDKEKKSSFKEFFEKNRSLMYLIPIFIILVITLILVYVLGGTGDTAEKTPIETDTTNITTPAPSEPTQDDPDENSNGVVTLPNNERDKDKSEILRNPLASPYKLSGIIYDKKNGSLAIIEAENKSYILKTGESAGSYFKVLEIKMNEVVLDMDGMEIILTMSGN